MSNSISRRELIGISALLGAAGVVYASKDLSLDAVLNPEEEVSLLKTTESLYVHNQGYPFKAEIPATYVKFRRTIFRLRSVGARTSDGTLSLAYKANGLHNPEENIKGDMAERSADLLRILLKNKTKFDGLETNVIKSFRFKNEPEPLIITGDNYEVPVHTAYASLRDVPIK